MLIPADIKELCERVYASDNGQFTYDDMLDWIFIGASGTRWSQPDFVDYRGKTRSANVLVLIYKFAIPTRF